MFNNIEKLQAIKLCLTGIEFLALIYFTGFAIFSSLNQSAIYFKLCYLKYNQNFSIDCFRLADVPEIQEKVQAEAAVWQTLLVAAVSIPAAITCILVSAWADRYGRKVNLLSSIASTSLVMFVLVCAMIYLNSPLWIIAVAFVPIGFLGFQTLFAMSGYQYLADSVVDHDWLTVRMTLFAGCWSFGYVIGGYLASILVDYFGYSKTFVIAQTLMLCASIHCVLFIKQKSPMQWRSTAALTNLVNSTDNNSVITVSKSVEFNTTDKVDTLPAAYLNDDIIHQQFGTVGLNDDIGTLPIDDTSNEQCERANSPLPPRSDDNSVQKSSTFGSFCFEVRELLFDTFHCFTRSRPGHIRIYLFLLAISFLFYETIDQGVDSVTQLFLLNSPISFQPDEISIYWSVTSLIQVTGGVLCSILLKRILNCSDTTVIMISMTSAALKMISLGLSCEAWMVWTSSGFGCISTMGYPAIESFVAQLVKPEEAGKVITGVGILGMIGPPFANLVYNPIYASTIEIFDGFIFMFVALLVVLSICLIFWIHIDYKKLNA